MRYSRGHSVTTAYQAGWAQLSNGALLAQAELSGFEVLVTCDKGFLTQQNLSGRNICVAVLNARSQNREDFMEVGLELKRKLTKLVVGQVTMIGP